MRRVLGHLLRFSIVAPLLLSLAMASCASTLPPAVKVQDFKTIAGKWQGTLTTPQTSVEMVLTIKDNGSFENITSAPIGDNTRFEGILRLREGQIIWLSRTSGRSGTYTLHEGDGRRVLTGRTDDGAATSKLTPVP